MSLFTTIETDCPACGVVGKHELVLSVNADRRPELRADIVDRSFQRLTCPVCAAAFRIQPQFTFVHSVGHSYITAWPSTAVDEWQERAARSEQAFQRMWGKDADSVAARIGSEMTRRVTFGWEATREKLVAADAGIDDVTLELAKLALMRTQDDIPAEGAALRLLGIDDEDRMVIAVVEEPDEHVFDQLLVPRSLLAEIEADAEAWAPLRERLAEGPFVDMQRLLRTPAET